MTLMFKHQTKIDPMTSSHMIYILWFAVFFFSLGISLFFGTDVRFPDEQDYINLGKNIYTGIGFTDSDGNPTASRPVMLPLLVSLGYKLGVGIFFVKIINALAVSFSGLLLALILSKYFPKAGWLPLLMIMGNPLIMFSSSLLAPQTIGTLLLLLIVFILIRDKRSPKHWLFLGFTCALLLSLIPAILLTLPLIFLLGLVKSKLSIADHFQRITYIVIFCAIFLTPWALRNLMEMNKFTPFSTQGGYNLILAYSENSTPTSGAEIDLSQFINDKFYRMGEVERDSYLTYESIKWIKNNSLRALQLYFGRIVNYFSSSNQLATENERSSFRNMVLFLSYYSMLIIAVVRIPLAHRFPFKREEILLWTIYIGNAFTSAIFLTRIRYRSPFDALLILIVSFTLCYLYQLWKIHRKERLAVIETAQ